MGRMTLTAATLTLATLFLIQPAVGAPITEHITLDTTPLIGHPAGPFYFALTVVDGDGVGDANNTVSVSDVTLGGGTAFGSPLALGGVSGDLAGGITITDSEMLNFFFEPFSAGSTLSFLFSFTNAGDAGGIPDRLTFSILDSAGVPLPTLAPAGDFLLALDLRSSGSVFELYGSDPTRPPSVGDPIALAAPTVTTPQAPVPEPATVGLLAFGLTSLAAARRRARRRQS